MPRLTIRELPIAGFSAVTIIAAAALGWPMAAKLKAFRLVSTESTTLAASE
jgi:hypothetical protein